MIKRQEINMNFFKTLLCFALIFFMLFIQANAADKKKQKRYLPSTYPYSYPYDEHPCPKGNCSRKNEKPTNTKGKNKKEMNTDED